MKVLVTGANGFVGRKLCQTLSMDPTLSVLAAGRAAGSMSGGHCVEFIPVGNINGATHWDAALSQVDVVVHLAGRAHDMKRRHQNIAIHRETNLHGTLHLAERAVAAGVRRMVFISSIKVNGDLTPDGRPFSEMDTPAPQGPYAISKWEAELNLERLRRSGYLDVVVIRPPLVYGPGVKANFALMIKWLRVGVPLPLGAVNNKRSLIGLGNLVDFIKLSVVDPRAKNHTFIVSDGEDVSTTELLRRLALVLDVRCRLLNVPPGVLRTAARLCGLRVQAEKFLGTLQVDSSKARKVLNWKPPYTLTEGLRESIRCE